MASVNKINIEKIKQFFLDLLFPRFCLGCGIEGTYLCDDCRAILEISEHRYCLCSKNAIRLPLNNKSGKCPKCSNKKLNGIYSALPYNEKSLTKKIIHLFKYPPYYAKDLSSTLASLIIDHLQLLEQDPKLFFRESVLIPVPLDKKKIRIRGYNQSEELAKEISRWGGVPLLNNILIKTKTTAAQMELAKKDREENLKNAFSCQNSDQIKKKKIFLIDDVYTTGTTLEECAKILKKYGAKEVWGIVVARGD